MPRSDDFDAATRELLESRLVAWVVSAAGVMQTAARHSRAVAAAERVVRDLQSLDPAVRVRLIALTLVIAIAAHLFLGMFVPAHVAPIWLARRV